MSSVSSSQKKCGTDLPMCNKRKRRCVGFVHCQIRDEDDHVDLDSEPCTWPGYIVSVDLLLDEIENYELNCAYVDDESNEKIPFPLVKGSVVQKTNKMLELTTRDDVMYIWSPSVDVISNWFVTLQKLIEMADKREPSVNAAHARKKKEAARRRAATQAGVDGVSVDDDEEEDQEQQEDDSPTSPYHPWDSKQDNHADQHDAKGMRSPVGDTSFAEIVKHTPVNEEIPVHRDNGRGAW